MRGVGGRGLSLDDRRGRFFKTLARRASLKGGALATRTVGIDALADLGRSCFEKCDRAADGVGARRGVRRLSCWLLEAKHFLNGKLLARPTHPGARHAEPGGRGDRAYRQ
jgi:hypothetical protein